MHRVIPYVLYIWGKLGPLSRNRHRITLSSSPENARSLREHSQYHTNNIGYPEKQHQKRYDSLMSVVISYSFQANDIKNLWSFVDNVLLPFVFTKKWYNGDKDQLEGFTDEKALYIMGMPRLRQLRNKPGTSFESLT